MPSCSIPNRVVYRFKRNARPVGPSAALKVDVTDRAGLEPALNTVESELGDISILVNNAGIGSFSGAVLLEKPEGWDRVIETQHDSCRWRLFDPITFLARSAITW
jgi:NAD(P)-dependent dehydrogenase (short-subunit alcohol dehydrogenase family)